MVNLNWFSKLSDELGLYSTLYYSGGRGGGTGTLGSLERQPFVAGNKWYNSSPWTWDWDATIARNDTSQKGSLGILRNSRNNQWTVGAISKAIFDLNSAVKITAGLDWRTAEIEHYREVRDLLGGDYFYSEASDFWSESDRRRGLGDKVAYDFTNTVDWLGGFGQVEYSQDKLSTYGMVGYSAIKYGYTNNFLDDGTGNKLTTQTDNIGGWQAKGGLSYRATETTHFYSNLGIVSRVPIFDDVIDDGDGSLAQNPKNQTFFSAEAGMNFRSLDGVYNLKFNGYYTNWQDRSKTRSITNQDGSEGLIFITGMNERYFGLELEGGFQPTPLFRLNGSASIANWTLTDDVSGVYKDYSGESGAQNVSFDFFVKDLKIGNAPQTQLSLSGILMPVDGFQTQLVLRYYADHYADWDPFTRTSIEEVNGERVQSWRIPNYGVVDWHASYSLPFDLSGMQISVAAHVFNVFNTTYIQEATDNSQFNAFDKDHDADDAEVFFGLPRFFNLGFSVAY